jgi:hypothetical protein
MEMQRRLKDSIDALTTETTRGRISAARWAAAITLTLVLIVLTAVLIARRQVAGG